MKVLFLDIDGVINSTRSLLARRGRLTLDEDKLARLVSGIERAQCKVVISSHWRVVAERHSQLRAVLRYHGIEVIGATPVLPPSSPYRPVEILEWLLNYNTQATKLERPHVSSFVAIDDRDLEREVGGEGLAGRFVRTDPSTGLTDADVERMISVLGGTEEPSPVVTIPGLPDQINDRRVEPIPHGEFGEVRLGGQKGSEHGVSRVGERTLRLFDMSLAFRDAWSGASVRVGNGTGKKPSPWIVTVSPLPPRRSKGGSSSSRARPVGALAATAADTAPLAAVRSWRIRRSTHEACSRLGGVTLNGTILGRGTFGVVFLGERAGERVAVKRAPANQTFNNVRLEAKLLQGLQHPHIVRHVGHFEDGSGRAPKLYLVLELCEGPDLQRLLDVRGALQEAEARHLLAQLIEALCYLRQRQVIHRDIKPANCLLRHALGDLRGDPLTHAVLKLTDFGFARSLDGSLHPSRNASRHLADAFARTFGSHSGHGASPPPQARSRSNSSAGDAARPEGALTADGSPDAQSCTGSSPTGLRNSCASVRRARAPERVGSADGSPFCRTDLPPSRAGGRSNVSPVCPRPSPSHGAPFADESPHSSSNPSSHGGSKHDGGNRAGSKDASVHAVTPKGTRFWYHPRLTAPAGKLPDGRLPLTRDEAFQLDVYPIGRLLRYMLTGIPPELSLVQAQDAADRAACIGCLLAAATFRRFVYSPRRVVAPSMLTEDAREALNAFLEPGSLSLEEARCHDWLVRGRDGDEFAAAAELVGDSGHGSSVHRVGAEPGWSLDGHVEMGAMQPVEQASPTTVATQKDSPTVDVNEARGHAQALRLRGLKRLGMYQESIKQERP